MTSKQSCPVMEREMDHTNILIERKTLTDGSHVFDVWLEGVCFSAVTQEDAEALANKLFSAITDHTNTTANVLRCAAAA
jgi:hypothetical protein